MSEVIKAGTQVIVKLENDLVGNAADDLKADIQALINESYIHITVDLSRVDMVDTMGISVLCAAHNSLSQNAGKLKVINVSESIFEAFHMMRLDQHFTVEKAKN